MGKRKILQRKILGRKFLKTALWLCAAIVVCAVSIFYALPALAENSQNKENEQNKSETGAVRLWNIDTFEGGKGSRTEFLKRISTQYEKSHKGKYVIVSSYTAEGARAAFSEGTFPDMLSFGAGFSDGVEKSLLIKNSAVGGKNFSGGEFGGGMRGVPWCRGGYALYTLGGDGKKKTKDTSIKGVISVGGNNLPWVAAAMEERETEPEKIEWTAEESTAAYVKFLNGEYKYLLGTQRDACRFSSRNTEVTAVPLTAFSDLYQYISVFSSDEQSRRICEEYISLLLTEHSQKELVKIGMLSPYYDIYSSDAPVQDDLERARIKYTVSIFLSDTARQEAQERAKGILRLKADGGESKEAEAEEEVLKNFLKTI